MRAREVSFTRVIISFDRRRDALDNLRQNDFEKGLLFAHAKDLCRFVLSRGYRLNAAPEYFGKIRGVIYDESYADEYEVHVGDRGVEEN